MLLGRDPFSHKGQMGHALLVAGSYGMAGAAILSARACLRSGVGKVTIHTPKKNREILQIAVPEAVLQFDPEETIFSEAVDTEDFQALGIGPGIGQSETTAIPMITQLRRATCPIVADADAINILGSHRAWQQQCPPFGRENTRVCHYQRALYCHLHARRPCRFQFHWQCRYGNSWKR